MEFLSLFPQFYSACPVPFLTVPELFMRNNIAGVKVRRISVFDFIWAKVVLCFSSLGLSLKILHWIWFPDCFLHLFSLASSLNETWAWKQVFRSYFQFSNSNSVSDSYNLIPFHSGNSFPFPFIHFCLKTSQRDPNCSHCLHSTVKIWFCFLRWIVLEMEAGEAEKDGSRNNPSLRRISKIVRLHAVCRW